jgi:hypothetical protein
MSFTTIKKYKDILEKNNIKHPNTEIGNKISYISEMLFEKRIYGYYTDIIDKCIQELKNYKKFLINK